jgi:hypothetical protein
VMPDALARFPDLVQAHDVEILSAAPELRGTVDATRETLTSLAIPKERTRFYSRMRTLRLAHGLTEFLRDYVRAADSGPLSLTLDRLDQADQTDQELAAVLVRRLDPAEITLVLGFGTDPDPESPLGLAVARHARSGSVAAELGALPDDPARRYVESECTDADERLREAYLDLPASERAALHDERADALSGLDGRPSPWAPSPTTSNTAPIPRRPSPLCETGSTTASTSGSTRPRSTSACGGGPSSTGPAT